MKTNQLSVLKQKLMALLSRLEEESALRIESLQEVLHPAGELTSVPTHAADRDVEGIDSQLAVGRLEDELRERVTAALKRMDEGTYGQCQRCGKTIPQNRLLALPDAPYCIQCEREIEQGK